MHIGDYKGSIVMNNRLLVKKILCALSMGVIINFSVVDTAFANEKNENKEIQYTSDVNGQEEQLKQIEQLSKDIANINMRLNQLTESLNKYNESLKKNNENTNIVDNEKKLSLEDIEEFNNNRKLDKKSKIVQEDENDWQKDFNKENELVLIKSEEENEKYLNNDEKITQDIVQDEYDVINDFEVTNKEYKINYNFSGKNNLKSTTEIKDNDENKKDNKLEKEDIDNKEKSKYKNSNSIKKSNDTKVNDTEQDEHNVINDFETINREYKVNYNFNDKGNLKSTAEVEDDDESKINNKLDRENIDREKENNSIENLNGKKINNIQQDEANDIVEDFELNNNIVDRSTIKNGVNGNKYVLNKTNKNLDTERISIDDINHLDIKNSTIDNKNRKNKKISIENNYMVNMENDNFIDLDNMNMLDRFNSKAPLWTYEHFEKLSIEGLLYPDEDFNLKALTRREAAILTARSYNLYKIKQRREQYETNTTKQQDRFISNDIDTLMREFYPEVKALGYDIVSEVTNTNVQYKQDYAWKIGGEIRYNYVKNTGSQKYEWDDSRLRVRLYGEKALSEDWILHTMLESDKSFIDDSIYTQERDGDIDLSRLYLETNQEWWGVPFNFEIGKTYAYLGDGNILDSDFKGIKVSAEATQNTNYLLGYGKVNDTEDMFYAEILNRNKDYDYLAGIYKWDNYGNPDIIKAFGMNYYTGNYTFGGMYLTSDLKDGSGADDGYVLSARYGRNISWIPHTFEFDVKYYNMAGNTYINHTMSGLGSYMDGFSGWGTMAYYTLAENLVLGLEYYDLEDKTTNEKGKTIWASLTYGF